MREGYREVTGQTWGACAYPVGWAPRLRGTRGGRWWRRRRSRVPNGEPPLLGGVDLHWYRKALRFKVVPDPNQGGQPPYWVRLIDGNGNYVTLAGETDDLLEDVGLPLDTAIYVTETNVQRDTFIDLYEGVDPDFVDAAVEEALRVLLRHQLDDPGLRLVFPFSPWFGKGEENEERYLISLTRGPVDGEPPTPTAVVVLEYPDIEPYFPRS